MDNKNKKDIWEKLSALSGLFSGGLIALVGIWATHSYNTRQLELSQIEALDKLKPSLQSEKALDRNFAYFMFTKLGYEDLAIELISLRGDVAGKDILTKLAKSDNPDVRKNAETVLKEILATETNQRKSTNGPIRAQLTFTNETDLRININWIDYKGVEEFNNRGVLNPGDSWLAGSAQSGNIYRVRIHDSQCEPFKRVKVTVLKVVEAPIQTLKITQEMINEEMMQQLESGTGC
jgi:hypothetical protein